MSLTKLPAALRAPTSSASARRSFSTTPQPRASVLFALHSLSNSRETQHFNKITRLNRVEHSPPLKLIQTSEVDPYPLPTPPPKPAVPLVRLVGGARSAARVWDEKALKVGKAVLADNARQITRLQRALERSKHSYARQERAMQRAQQSWQQESRKMRNEMRIAGVWIVASIATATALATWRFWPQQRQIDSAELGRKIAEKAQRALPLPAAVSPAPAAASEMSRTPAPAPAVEPALATTPPSTASAVTSQHNGSWWRSLFWKQQ